MNGQISDLLSWETGGYGIPDALYARIQANPLFPAASLKVAANTRAGLDADKTFAGICKDAGRYVTAMWAMYLHVSGGLTLPRLKETCAQSGFLSPGRARGLLLYMRYLGFVVPAAQKIRGQPARYDLTDSFVRSWRHHLCLMLEAAQIVEPAVSLVAGNMDRDDVLHSVSRIQGEGLFTLARDGDRETALIRVFLHRHAGPQIMHTLLLASPDGIFPPRTPLDFSIGAVSRRFSVSRIHIRRMLDDAVRNGLLNYDKDGTVTLTDLARAELVESYSMQLIQLLRAAAITLRTVIAPAAKQVA